MSVKTKGKAMDQKNKFTAETVRQLQQSLDEIAPYEATEVSKQQAIRMLSPQILSLRSKGYNWTAVAAMLSEQGVPVSVAALRTYLRRVREEAEVERPSTSTKRARDGRAVARQPQPPPSIAPSLSSSAASPASKPEPLHASPAPTVGAQQTNATTPRRQQESRRPAVKAATDDAWPDGDDL
jgi:hypothetical protein